MSRTGVGCRVMVDGKELDDGCIDWLNPPPNTMPEGVSAAEGLSIVWGRDTTVDQPQASTCTFTAVDDPGGTTVLDAFKLGSTVDVFADAVISGGGIAQLPPFTDPGFETSLRATTTNTTATRSQARTDGSSWSARLARPDPTRQGTTYLPPGVLQAPGTNPLAWIDLASTAGGQTWHLEARIWVPPALTITMRPVLYTGPYSTAATPQSQTVQAVGGSVGAWQTLALDFAPGASAAWVGFGFDVVGGVSWGQAVGTWASTDPALSWGDFEAVYIDHVAITAPGGGTTTTVLVFSGRITDMEGVFDQEWDTPAMRITATDFLGDLGNRYIGDEPWPQETLTNRVARIVNQAVIPNQTIQAQIAPTLGAVLMSWLDVDRRAAAGLLTDVAQSPDGVLWSATHPVIGPYLRFEDPAQRLPLYQLQLVGGVIRIVLYDYSGAENPPPDISACDILRDPVTFTRDVGDIATRAKVTWLEQGVDEDMQIITTDRNYELIDAQQEQAVGTRSISLSTILTNAADAERVADQLLARLESSWRITGLAVADADLDVPDSAAATMLITLLNGITRGGQALLLTDLPAWSPVGETAPIYLEGGTYSFSGGWTLNLNVSRAAGVGQNAQWDELPRTGWTWDAVDPSITWDDLRGVAAP